MELSVGCELVSAGRSHRHAIRASGHQRLPLGQSGRVAKLV